MDKAPSIWNPMIIKIIKIKIKMINRKISLITITKIKIIKLLAPTPNYKYKIHHNPSNKEIQIFKNNSKTMILCLNIINNKTQFYNGLQIILEKNGQIHNSHHHSSNSIKISLYNQHGRLHLKIFNGKDHSKLSKTLNL
jgi:hypothetical protein